MAKTSVFVAVKSADTLNSSKQVGFVLIKRR
nr:MAG TPA: hypothetical protein [Caudoviricetes sp.]